MVYFVFVWVVWDVRVEYIGLGEGCEVVCDVDGVRVGKVVEIKLVELVVWILFLKGEYVVYEGVLC